MATSSAPRYYTYKSLVPLKNGESLHFTAGKGYHAGPTPAAVRTPPPPPTEFQRAQQQVATTFAPVVSSTAKAFNDRAAQEQAAITGYTSELAKLMGGYGDAAKQAYGAAAASQAAVDAAFAATRAGQGSAAQSELAAKLGSMGVDPATSTRITSSLGSDFAGESKAAAGRGAASLSALLAEGAQAQDYGAKLPGVAGLYGLNATKQAQGRITSELSQALAQLESQRPGAVQSALAQIQQNRNQVEANRQAAAALGVTKTKTVAAITHQQNDDIAARQRLANEQARIAVARTNADLARQRIGLQRKRDQQSLDNQIASGKKPNAALSRVYGYMVDSNGQPILNAKGNRIPVKVTSANPFDVAPTTPAGK